MIEKFLKNCWTNAFDLFNYEKLNPNGVFVDKFERMIIDRRAFKCISTSSHPIAEPAKTH